MAALVSTIQKIMEGQRDSCISNSNTKLTEVQYGNANFSQNQLPAARMRDTGARLIEYIPAKSDIMVHQMWMIYGRTPDEVTVILEQLQFLFYKESERTTLQALGFVGYDMTTFISPAPIQGKNMTGAFLGVIELDVRMTVKNPY